VKQIEQAVAAVRSFDYDRPRTALAVVEKLIKETYGKSELRERIEKELAKMLASDVSVACKQFICKKLWMIGTDVSVPVLEQALADPDMRVGEAACYALSRHPSPAAGRALRNGLDKASGNARVAVVNLVGDRRDATSAVRLAELANDADELTADAATTALGKIATSEAVGVLSRLHRDAQGKPRAAAAHALLESAQELGVRGKATEARAILEQLGTSDIPHIRRGARIALRQGDG
jgi:HEAT repeat protein